MPELHRRGAKSAEKNQMKNNYPDTIKEMKIQIGEQFFHLVEPLRALRFCGEK